MIKEIERVKKLLGKEFEQQYLNKTIPVIISSGLTWDAFKWTPDYFKNLFPNKTIDLEVNYSIPIGDKNSLKSKVTKKTSMGNAVDLIYENKNPNMKYYLCQQSIYKEFPELVQDFGKPPWNNENIVYGEHSVNLWFGEAGNATPIHFDCSHNFLIQIYGKKYIRLFAPEDTKYLYHHTSQTQGSYHLSQISDIDNYDDEEYPQFKNALAYEAILLPEETLFIPAGWWHDIRSLDHAISINFWWKPKIQGCLLSQILPLSIYEFYEIGGFNEINFFADLSDFKDDLEIAKYFMENKNYRLSILFMANFFVNTLKSIGMLLNIAVPQKNAPEDIENINQSILLIDKYLGIPTEDLSFWLELIKKVKNEESTLFEQNNLISMFEQIQVFSNKIKRILLKNNPQIGDQYSG